MKYICGAPLRTVAFSSGKAPGRVSRSALRVEANKRVQKKEKVILVEDVPSIGSAGEIKAVPSGYWRNYLLPRGLAKFASESILEGLRKKKEAEVRKKLEEKALAQAFANALSTIGKFILKKKVGDKEQVFGSVTVSEIADAIYQQTGRSVADCEFEVPEIKTVGTYECRVKLHPEVVGTFSIVIQKEKVAPQALKVVPSAAPAKAAPKKAKK